MIRSAALLADLKRRVSLLETDLRVQAEDPDVVWSGQLRSEYEHAIERGRTALTWTDWLTGEVAQAAVAWVIASTFVRFCEDNGLLVGHPSAGRDPVWLAGPGDRMRRAEENRQAHYEQHPTDNTRDWFRVAFGALADLPAGRDLVDRSHNLVWRAPISAAAADDLYRFWQTTDDDGALVHDFTDPDLGTRFLGDLYQDLSEHAKKTYALLQTPVFVEEFILDRTLEPAVAEFGLDGLKLIDPTCGSGHFLLGAFDRLNDRWHAAAPALSARERVQKALDSIHGVDLNPFAVAIARFRLTVAALKASGDTTLTAAPTYSFHLAVGDSLLGTQGRQGEFDLLATDDDDQPFTYASEDIDRYKSILEPGTYHVVVGNPPYITVKDKALNARYRELYPKVCSGKYALSAPFMEVFFRLAKRGDQHAGAGYVGKITSNSFMKREFGRKLIENYLSGKDPHHPVDLTAVIDTSGAYIPGHGTPTVILTGRPRRPIGDTVKAALGVRGEPVPPIVPSEGVVWREIVGNVDEDLYEGLYVTIANIPRLTLASHPWSLTGAGASHVMDLLDTGRRLKDESRAIGYSSITGDDEYLIAPRWLARRLNPHAVPYVIGESIRDFGGSSQMRV